MDFDSYLTREISFAELGRDSGAVDCWGLVCLFYREQMGIDLPLLTGTYSSIVSDRAAIGQEVERQIEQRWEKVSAPRSGDVVLCRMLGRPMHVGIFQEGGYMLHIEEGNHPTLERLDSTKWNKRILGYYRLRS